jgi:1-hydroxycarotenoid 3,4-desaturase
LFILVNAPPRGDRDPFTTEEIRRCEERMQAVLWRSGSSLKRTEEAPSITTPAELERLFPATGGALYGSATIGMFGAFSRPSAATRMPGLYLAGGSVHPGAGVPMAATSGRLAAGSVLAGLASTSRSTPVAMLGGTSMR